MMMMVVVLVVAALVLADSLSFAGSTCWQTCRAKASASPSMLSRLLCSLERRDMTSQAARVMTAMKATQMPTIMRKGFFLLPSPEEALAPAGVHLVDVVCVLTTGCLSCEPRMLLLESSSSSFSGSRGGWTLASTPLQAATKHAVVNTLWPEPTQAAVMTLAAPSCQLLRRPSAIITKS